MSAPAEHQPRPREADPLDAEDLRALLHGLKRRTPLVIGVACLFGVLAALRSFNLPTVFAASARLLLAKEAPDPTRAKYAMYSADYVAREYLTTQMHILESHSLAVQAIKDNPKIAQELELDLRRFAPDAQGASPEQLANLLRGGVKVTSVDGTYLVDLSYESEHPDRCAPYANALAAAYRKHLETIWGEKTQIATEKIGQQTELLFKKLTKSEQALKDFLNDGHQTPLLEAHEKLLVERIHSNNAALLQIQQERIRLNAQLESIQRVLEQGKPLESAAPIARSKVVYDLRGDLVRAELALTGLRERFGDAWPEVREAAAKRDQLQLQLQAEIKAIRAQLQSERDERVAEEQGLLERDRLLQEESRALSQRRRLYEHLKGEVDANRKFYEEFAQRLNELLNYAHLNETNARVVDQAQGAWRVRPSHSRNVIMGLLLGGAIGVVIAFLLERLSDRLRTLKDAVNALQLPVLGVVPDLRHEEEVELLALRDARSVYAEAFRRARVQLNAVGAFPDEGCGVLMCVSGVPREGKTLSAINLAIASAQAGRRTLLLDADMRSPRVHKVLGIPVHPGLADALEEQAEEMGDRLHRTQVENLWVMTAGKGEVNPGELLARDDAFHQLIWRLRRRFDRIVIDSPPVVAVSDATLMAPAADAVLLVISGQTSSRTATTQARTELGRVGAAPVGLLFNQQNQDEAGQYYYYYSRYGYGGSPEREEAAA
ncbi:MAG: GumC family protein [Planctomycetota bacterium]